MENTISISEMTRIRLDPILIGSRKHDVNEDDSDYDYLLIVPESRVSDTLSMWTNADIIEYVNTPDLSATLPINAGYRIKGITDDNTASLLSTPIGSLYDILIVLKPDIIPDSNFILSNINLYRMICMYESIPYIDHNYTDNDIKMRLRSIRSWAKIHGVYGGVYPDGMGYLIYAINTMRKGYTLSKSIKMISTRYLYYDDEYKYGHISYVSDKSFKHMSNIVNGRSTLGKYQYQILSARMDEVLRMARKLLDECKCISHIDSSGIIHASSDVSESLSSWSSWLQSLDIDIRIAEMK